MRRKDRQVTDFQEIVSIIGACPIVRLGLADGDYPYVVPVNFAYDVEAEQIYLYIHSAKAGRKYGLMIQNRKCSFEMDVFGGVIAMPEKKDSTTIYHSVMGKAEIEFLEGEAAFDCAKRLMARYDATRHAPFNEAVVPNTCFARLKVVSIDAKANRGPDHA
ncbi:MAG: pyridoxamine 5'-phosphate oxidase family protein [Firmicutes bacterium]|nr:pyridoxamine 5'-phosphate oxidase family protein [Bacillota bacterium]